MIPDKLKVGNPPEHGDQEPRKNANFTINNNFNS